MVHINIVNEKQIGSFNPVGAFRYLVHLIHFIVKRIKALQGWQIAAFSICTYTNTWKVVIGMKRKR